MNNRAYPDGPTPFSFDFERNLLFGMNKQPIPVVGRGNAYKHTNKANARSKAKFRALRKKKGGRK